MTNRVRILRAGLVQVVVDIDDYDIACGWAYDTMRLHRQLDQDGAQWAATVQDGRLFVDPWGKGKSYFAPGVRREGLVLDKRVLHRPDVDLDHLFGLR